MTDPMSHDDLVLLVDWLADFGDYTGREIAEVVRKPWNYTKELTNARAAKYASEPHGAWHNAGTDWGSYSGPTPPDIEPCWCDIGKDHDAPRATR